MFDPASPILRDRDRRGRLGRRARHRRRRPRVMMEHAYYSVISPRAAPRSCGRTRAHAPDAAEALEADRSRPRQLGLIDGVIPEPGRRSPRAALAMASVKKASSAASRSSKRSRRRAPGQRREKFRRWARSRALPVVPLTPTMGGIPFRPRSASPCGRNRRQRSRRRTARGSSRGLHRVPDPTHLRRPAPAVRAPR
jgi:hypothetical protein